MSSLCVSLRLVVLISLLGPSARAAEIAVEGQILSPDLRGLAGALVGLSRIPGPHESGVLQLEGRLDVEPVVATRSDKRGFFLLTAPEAGMWGITVRADGFVPMEYALLPLLEPRVLPPVSLPFDAKLTVHVAHPDFEAWGAATVRAKPTSHRPGWRPAARLARSDRNGVAVLPRAAGEELSVSAWSASSSGLSAIRSSDADVTLKLRSGCDRTVVVRHGDELVSNVLIRAGSRPVALTNGDGRATIRFPGHGNLQLGFEMPHGGGAGGWFEPVGDTSVPLVVHLPRTRSVSGRVIDKERMGPIAAAFVWLSGSPWTFVRTDSEGTFQLPRGGSEVVSLHLAAEGYLGAEVVLVDGLIEAPESIVTLSPAAAVSGTVLDARGDPLAGAEIEVSPSPHPDAGGYFRGQPRRVGIRTAARGRFHVGNLDPGGAYRLRVTRAGSAPSAVSVRPDRMKPVRLEVVLGPGHTVSGSLVDEQRLGIEGATIHLVPVPLGPDSNAITSGADTDNPSSWKARSAPGGRFELRHIPAGTFALGVRKAGFAIMIERIEVAKEDRLLEPMILQRGEVLVGQLHTPAGDPVEGARIQFTSTVLRLLQKTEEDLRIHSDSEGRFLIPDLQEEQSFELSITHPDFRPLRTEVSTRSREPVSRILHPHLFVTGQVVDPSGVPIVDAKVHLVPLTDLDSVSINVTDPDGRFAFTHLDPGAVRVSASAESYQRSQPAIVEIAEGRTPDILLILYREE